MTNLIGLYTLIKRELKRTTKIINQVIWPPLISTLLYIFVFGFSLGTKIKSINDVPYLEFLIPGLIIMSVIDNSYGERSAWLFIGRFTYSIQEILIAPLSYFEIVLGYLIGSVLRGLLIGNLIMLLAFLVLGITIKSYFFCLFFMVVVSALFSLIGMIVALWAETFDNLAILTTFFITPLIFFGGVFHSITMLPETFQKISLFNPFFYMIDGFRYSITGKLDGSLLFSVILVLSLTILFFLITLILFRKGYKLRT